MNSELGQPEGDLLAIDRAEQSLQHAFDSWERLKVEISTMRREILGAEEI